eukprot:289753-Amphidinium_carterae.1
MRRSECHMKSEKSEGNGATAAGTCISVWEVHGFMGAQVRMVTLGSLPNARILCKGLSNVSKALQL